MENTVTKINDRIYRFNNEIDAAYLVIGTERAAVIDTMSGQDDLKAGVRRITDLPLIIINTHGHGDHTYGNAYFRDGEASYLNPKDLEVAKWSFENPEFREALEKYGFPVPEFKEMHAGDVFDLGGVKLEVIELPGHTAGSVCLLDREDRALFTGDSINHHLWIQLEESLSVQENIDALEKILWVKNEADIILHGHAQHGVDDIGLIDRLIAGLKDLLATHGEGDEDYKWFLGVAKQHRFEDGHGVIVY